MFEVANALRSGRSLAASVVLDSLQYLRNLDLQLEPLRWTTLWKTVEIAASCGATVYDSYFLAMALESDSVLVTADQIFLRKARRYPGIVSIGSVSLPG
jgi:predicted nucleic acid-binding protein